MFSGNLVVIALIIFALVTLAKGVRVVPQGTEWIIERLGKYHRTLLPGLNFIIPYIDLVASKIITKDIILDVQEQEVITKDNAVILTNAIAFIKVTDPIKAVYGVTDFSIAIRNLIMTTLRSIIGEMSLDEALTNRDRIKARLKESIADEAIDWGLTIKSVEIQDIRPTPSMQQAMEMQASAEREKKAMVTKAEGEKQSIILQSEAQLEASQRQAQAQINLADASAKSIANVTAALGSGENSVRYLLCEKYISALDNLSTSNNAKTILIPADIQKSIEGLLGKKQ